ncbi:MULTISPECIES: sigma-70 family RNA polymerase sigma factor [unclassified Bacillus (in: firmicutes)]|uniref:sigma-70 family RNA polymerase sigma factor n=1 Tax=unclassified Bacillus (in: firmicutes) TaxID=185979 RepID=UPI0008DEFA01|nr:MULTISPECIES: sigma-70 family RNA polymerase sigma factor [unclassified Bacillus (in: firmicutes)]SFB07314.1 RNA polymerase, sigma subunit, SigV [Bacillus sp. UNCCL13]SFQ87389.1 RNA polymerase, sigma subunit, SigV [Bacillus sp. cl95]
MQEEERLAEQAINGDDEAFLKLIHLYKIDLYKTALSYLRNEGEALEAIQEVTYRAYKKIHTVRDASFIKTWLIRIMINYCNDFLKKKKRLMFVEEMIQSQPVSETHMEMEIKDAMQGLDERSREILTLKYFHDLKIKDIAKTLDCPEGTIKTWLNKALKSLREKLGEKGGNLNV